MPENVCVWGVTAIVSYRRAVPRFSQPTRFKAIFSYDKQQNNTGNTGQHYKYLNIILKILFLTSLQKVILQSAPLCVASQGYFQSLKGGSVASIAFRGVGNVMAPWPTTTAVVNSKHSIFLISLGQLSD